jgi:hypothetical protein
VHLVGDEVPHKDKRYYGTDAWGVLGFHHIPENVVYRMSVSNKSDVVTLLNDEQDPDYGQVYGVDIDLDKGWIYPREHPFRFQQTSDTGGDVTAGTVMFEGSILTISGLPTSLSDVKTTICYYISLDTDAGTAAWGSATSFPAGSSTVMIFRILKIICTDDIITGIEQHRWSDICVGAVETEEPDPVDPSGYVDILSRDGNDPPTGPGTSTAKVDHWHSGETNGLHVWVNVGTVWDGYADTPVLYYMARQLVITTKGKVFYTGVEVRITIDTPINHATL